MAEPAAEQIMQAVVARIQTLTASIPGLIIEEGEDPPFGAERFIHITQGLEISENDDQFGTQQSRVLLDIEITVGGQPRTGEKLRTVLNGMLGDVKQVLRADHTLGGLCSLRWLSNTYGEPDKEEGLPRQNIAVSEWQADYTHAYGDPTTILPQ